MYKVEDFKVGEKVVINDSGEKAIVIDVNVASSVVYVRSLVSGVKWDILDVTLLDKCN
jgi:hypothetical protein